MRSFLKTDFNKALTWGIVTIAAFSILVAIAIGFSAISAVQPHQGKVAGVASYICCLGRQHFVLQFDDRTTVDCSAESMSASDIITITNLKVGDNISMFGTCHDVKVLSR